MLTLSIALALPSPDSTPPPPPKLWIGNGKDPSGKEEKDFAVRASPTSAGGGAVPAGVLGKVGGVQDALFAAAAASATDAIVVAPCCCGG